MERHGAMIAGSNRDSGSIKDFRNVMRMEPLYGKSQHAVRLWRPVHGEAGNFGNLGIRVAGNGELVLFDRGNSFFEDIACGRSQTDHARDVRGSALESVWRFQVGYRRLRHFQYCTATGHERSHAVGKIIFYVERTDAGGPVHFMP